MKIKMENLNEFYIKKLEQQVEQLQAELATVTAGKVTIVKDKFYPADKELIEQLQAENARLKDVVASYDNQPPIAWTNRDGTYVELSNKSTVYGSHTIPLIMQHEVMQNTRRLTMNKKVELGKQYLGNTTADQLKKN